HLERLSQHGLVRHLRMRAQGGQSGRRHRRLPEGPHLRRQGPLRPLHSRPRLHEQGRQNRQRRRTRSRPTTLPADARSQPRHGRSRQCQEEHRQHPGISQTAALMGACAIISLMRSAILPGLIVLFVLQARPANDFSLTVDSIMRGPAQVGYEPTGVRWSHDGSRILFQWKQSTDKEIAPMDTYTVARDGSGLRKLTAEEVRLLPPAVGDTTKDKRLMVYSSAGDLFTVDNDTGKMTQLTKTADAETDPHFTRDGKRISFTRNGNLYVMSLDSGMLVQLTDIRPAAPPATSAVPAGGGRGGRGAVAPAAVDAPEPRGTDSQEYLKQEQKELLQAARERIEVREE